MSRLIDLSHTIVDGLVTYKGLPPPLICDYLSREDSKAHYAPGTSFQIGQIQLCSNTGTYIDAPFHRYEDGKDIADLDLTQLAGLEGIKVVVDPSCQAIGPELFEGLNLKDKAVLVQTGWSRHWNSEQYYEGHNFLTEAAANYLKSQEVKLVGIDSYNIDDVSQGARPVHSTLLGADILIVEHMCALEQLPEQGFKFYAVPVKVKGMGTFPVRAFAQLD